MYNLKQMTAVMILFNCVLLIFAGYAIGRMGHIYGGHLNAPHHWIYGAMLFFPGVVFSNEIIFLMFSFGLGLIISDLKDFLNLKLWGIDNVEIKKFWGID